MAGNVTDEDIQTKMANDLNDPTLKYNIQRQEYMAKLKKWLEDTRTWHYNARAGLPSNYLHVDQMQNNQRNNLANYNIWNDHSVNRFPTFTANLISNRNNATTFPIQPNIQQMPGTYEFVVPPLWKRAVAELMDFFLLFLFKMAVTFLVLESLDIIDMTFYGLETLQKNLENAEAALPMAIELLTLEVLHRIIVCGYETFFLRGKFCATPGKRYMGLMVISAESITPGRRAETVYVTRGAPLNWHKSLMRSALKNLFIGLFLPIFVAFYVFPHNRTSYDVMSNSIVVEYHHGFIMYHLST